MVTVDDVINRLDTRASNHGLEMEDLLEKIPPEVRDSHEEVDKWLDIKQVSHDLPVSTHPHLASDPDNIRWEDASTNMARGATPTTEAEKVAIELDNSLDASLIDGHPFDAPDPEWADVLIQADVFPDMDIPVDFDTPWII